MTTQRIVETARAMINRLLEYRRTISVAIDLVQNTRGRRVVVSWLFVCLTEG